MFLARLARNTAQVKTLFYFWDVPFFFKCECKTLERTYEARYKQPKIEFNDFQVFRNLINKFSC